MKAAKQIIRNKGKLGKSLTKEFAHGGKLKGSLITRFKNAGREFMSKDFEDVRKWLFSEGTFTDFAGALKRGLGSKNGILMGLKKEFGLGYQKVKGFPSIQIIVDVGVKGLDAGISTTKAISDVFSSETSVVHKVCSFGAPFGDPGKDATELMETVSDNEKW